MITLRSLRPRFRRLIVLLILALAFVAGVSLSIDRVLLRSFQEIESEAIRQSTDQVVKALQSEVRQLASTGERLASSGELQSLMLDQRPGSSPLSLFRLRLRQIGVDVVYVLDPDGAEIFSTEQPSGNVGQVVPATLAVRQVLHRNLEILGELPDERADRLLLRLPGGVAVVDSRPILPPDSTGRARRTLILVRMLSPLVIERMSSAIQLPISVWILDQPAPRGLAAEVVGWARGSLAPPRLAMPLDRFEIGGHVRLAAFDGSPIVALSTRIPRAAYLQGRKAAHYLLGVIAFMVVVVIVVTAALDLKLERSGHQALASETLYQAMVEQAEEGLILFDPHARSVLQLNPAVVRLTGRTAEEVKRQGLEALLDSASLPVLSSALDDAPERSRSPCEIVLRHANGSLLEVELSASPVLLQERRLVSLMLRDVSERKLADAQLHDQQRRLEHLANHDTLTGLPNRLYLNSMLPGLIETASHDSSALAVCYVDVDHFKHINDSSGHEVGDCFLRVLAERLRHIVARDDLVARMSGDEFVVVAMATDPQAFESMAKRIIDQLRKPLNIEGRDFAVSISMGVAVSPRDGTNAPELLRSADIALYQAKERGRGHFQFFVPEMNEKVRERTRLEQALRTALAERQIHVHYQPLIDLRTERIAGFEALARWRHPQMGDIPPAQFIPVAEDAGLIVALGDLVLRQVCAQLAEWRKQCLPVVPVAVNVSAQQLQHTQIRDRVLGICAEFGVPPSLLQIELTESTVMREIDRQIGALEGLRAAGVRISIDDFGTGYSSLSYLKHLPIDHLKIDRSFVRDMAVDSNDAAIVSAIISMARSLKLETIAEGVETAQHALRLTSLGCDFAQGYYYSGPLAAAECGRLLEAIGRNALTEGATRLRIAGAAPG